MSQAAGSSKKMQIFVRFDMGGKGTKTISDVSYNTTVKEFKQRLMDIEGPQVESLRLVFGGKQLSKDELTLADYDIHNESTIFAAMRLLGGAYQPDRTDHEGGARNFDRKKVEKFGCVVTDRNCLLGISVGCYLSTVKRIQFQCNHVLCADCAHYQVKNSVENARCAVACADSGCPKGDLSMSAAMAAAGYTDAECKEIEVKLSENAFKGADASMIVCPNDKCQAFIFRDINQNNVRCPKCRAYDFCFLCKKKWKSGGDLYVCGNEECNASAAFYELLVNCRLKEIWGIKDVPECRLCPNPNCKKFNEHAANCKHMTCSCKHEYCHVCLKKWGKEDGECNLDITCSPAPTQRM